MTRFDYNAPAEVYAGRSMRGSSTMMYQRFDTGAEAVQYAMEVMPRPNFKGAIIEADERRYWHGEIQKLYDAPEYPLTRNEPKILARPGTSPNKKK